MSRIPKLALSAGVSAALMLVAFSVAAYSFTVGHRAACDGKNATADLFHDVIVIASAPVSGQKPRPTTEAQRHRLDLILARINQIRC